MWKPIEGYEEFEVSETGAVRRVGVHVLNARWKKGRELTQTPSNHGAYMRVTLRVAGKKRLTTGVHRLVAKAFIGPPPSERHQINHLDGNQANNHVGNLEWVTPKENMRHAAETGLRDQAYHSGSDHWMSKQPERIPRGDDWHRVRKERGVWPYGS